MIAVEVLVFRVSSKIADGVLAEVLEGGVRPPRLLPVGQSETDAFAVEPFAQRRDSHDQPLERRIPSHVAAELIAAIRGVDGAPGEQEIRVSAVAGVVAMSGIGGIRNRSGMPDRDRAV